METVWVVMLEWAVIGTQRACLQSVEEDKKWRSRDAKSECVCPAQDMLKSLSEEMDENMIPVAYGGQNTLPLYESKQEIELWELVRRLNSTYPSKEAGTIHKLEQLNGATEAEP